MSTLRFISHHPLTRDHRLRAIQRYVAWQLRSRLLRKAITVPFIDGAVLRVRQGMTGATGNIYCGLHEFEDMAFALHLLRPGDCFADVGANVGSYTVLAGSAAGADVVAVEPVGAAFEALRANVQANRLEDRVTAFCCGAGATESRIGMTSTQDTTNHVLAPGEESDASQMVALRPIDVLCGQRRPVLVKLDVEGFEMPALEGAR